MLWKQWKSNYFSAHNLLKHGFYKEGRWYEWYESGLWYESGWDLLINFMKPTRSVGVLEYSGLLGTYLLHVSNRNICPCGFTLDCVGWGRVWVDAFSSLGLAQYWQDHGDFMLIMKTPRFFIPLSSLHLSSLDWHWQVFGLFFSHAQFSPDTASIILLKIPLGSHYYLT